MRLLFFLAFIISCLLNSPAGAQQRTEAELISRIFSCLQHNDSKVYGDLFPGIDSLSQWVFQYADPNSESYRKMLMMRNSPYAQMEADSSLRGESERNFTTFLASAKALNVHWGETVLMRFELEKIRRGRGLITEHIAPLRFMGYVFFKDLLTQKTYAFTVFDLMQVNGLWYGGELVSIFEAPTKENFQQALIADKKRKRMMALGLTGSTGEKNHVTTDEEEDTDKPSILKEVAARKFYKGRFDNEISVQLYVRYIKGGCPEGICSWEALFKFGDEDEFIPMTVSRNEEGKWLFTEELGGMELMLSGDIYTGVYAANSDKTEYEVKLVEVPVSNRKLEALDEMLDLRPATK